MSRRNFTQKQKEQIVERSKNAEGFICCEGCGLVLGAKPYEIDHILAEGLRPEADKKKKITIAEGQLLGRDCCHRGPDGKTNADVKKIAKAKRQYNRSNGIKRNTPPIQSRGFTPSPKSAGRQPKQALPPKALYRSADT